MTEQRPPWWPTAEQKRHRDAGCAHPDVCKLEAAARKRARRGTDLARRFLEPSSPLAPTREEVEEIRRHCVNADHKQRGAEEQNMTVADLIEVLESCDPESVVALAASPAWPMEYLVKDAVEGMNGSVYLVEGEQIGYLPEAVQEDLGW